MQHQWASPFEYTRSERTDIRRTFERFGFRPTTDAERLARQSRTDRVGAGAQVTGAAGARYPES